MTKGKNNTSGGDEVSCLGVISLSSASGDGSTLRPTHNEWKAVATHTAKCDRCNKHNKDNTVQRCVKCSRQFCNGCIVGAIANDSAHFPPEEGFNWTPKTKAKAYGPPLTHKRRASTANRGSRRGSSSSSANYPRSALSSKVDKCTPRKASRLANRRFKATGQNWDDESEDCIMYGGYPQGPPDTRAHYSSNPNYNDQGSETDYEPMAEEQAQCSARSSGLSNGAPRHNKPTFEAQQGNERQFEYLRSESWKNDPILKRIRSDEGDSEANQVFESASVLMRLTLGFFRRNA